MTQEIAQSGHLGLTGNVQFLVGMERWTEYVTVVPVMTRIVLVQHLRTFTVTVDPVRLMVHGVYGEVGAHAH